MRTKNISILVVEDEFIHRETIVNNLKELGYFKIFEATNAKEALLICKQENIVLSFVDIGLMNSNLDGIELAKEINLLSQSSIVFTTSYSDKSTLERITDVRFEEYILKPVDERRLFVAIELVMSKSSSKIQEALISQSRNSCPLDTTEDVFVKGNTKFFYRIPSDNIIYVKAELGGINIVTIDKTQFTYTSLSNFISYYNNPDILRIHRSYAVNKRHVIGKSDTELKMIDGTVLSIGSKQRPKVNQHFLMLKPKLIKIT